MRFSSAPPLSAARSAAMHSSVAQSRPAHLAPSTFEGHTSGRFPVLRERCFPPSFHHMQVTPRGVSALCHPCVIRMRRAAHPRPQTTLHPIPPRHFVFLVLPPISSAACFRFLVVCLPYHVVETGPPGASPNKMRAWRVLRSRSCRCCRSYIMNVPPTVLLLSPLLHDGCSTIMRPGLLYQAV